MKIESAAAYRYINKTYAATVNTAPAMEALVRSEPMKTDKLHISGEAAGRGEIGRLTQSIAVELSTSASSAKLQALREQIQNQEYFVPSDELADSILGLLF